MSAWRPIESFDLADGEAAIFYNADERVVDVAYWDTVFSHFYTLQCGAWHRGDVTHWMPLPPAPEKPA